MYTNILKRWVADLRSNPDLQGKDALFRVKVKDQQKQWCCLGRLVQMYMDETGKGSWTEAPAVGNEIAVRFFNFGPEDNSGLLPDEVMKWAGLTEANPLDLAELNDEGMPFTEAADLIERLLS